MATPAATILSHVPESARSTLFLVLVRALQPDDGPSIDFVASAIAESGDRDSRELLLSFLQRAVEAGKPDGAVSVGRRYPELGGSLFARSTARLSSAKSADQPDDDNGLIESCLRFCKSMFDLLPVEVAHAEAFSASLELTAHADQRVCDAARDLIFAALASITTGTRCTVVLQLSTAIWLQVHRLCSPECKKRTQVLGYSIWLRWLLSVTKADMERYIDEQYSDLLIRGLREGDAEMRKICLNILRVSIRMDSKATAESLAQFERYATVFETIVLGRYINQVQECEKDLDYLISDESHVGSEWLYALLASALDGEMQDSNRRFIGNWVMRASVHSGAEYATFLRADFLPWATQGSLYVASLTSIDGMVSCSHGARLTSYIRNVLQQFPAPEKIQRIIWSFMVDGAFAYAKVYLLQALGDVNDSACTRGFVSDASNALSQGISSGEWSSERILRGLPDVAHDYVSSRLGSIALNAKSEALESRRDVLEKGAIAKCSNINDLDGLDDLWGDLEYLEFPKNLLFHIPSALLGLDLIDKASTADDLAASIRCKTKTLQKVAVTKTYVVSPLVISLRTAFLHRPQAFDLFELGDYILHAVDHPPQPTIDLMLEEATVHLFANYEDYFGERPSHGIAALLDLVSRIHDQEHLKDLVDRLLSRWKAQRVPPPTVSTWKTVLQLQTLLLSLENLNPTNAQARELAMDLLHVLSIEPLPRYRYLLEWMAVRLLQRMGLEDIVLEQLASKNHHAIPKYLASLMKVGCIIACSQTSKEAFATRLATLCVPLAASSKIVIRHEAQWQVPTLLEHARTKKWARITSNPAFTALDDYIRSLERFHDPPPERRIGRFDPEMHHTLTNLVEGPWSALDSTEAPLTSRDEFVKLYARELPEHAAPSCMRLGDATAAVVPAAPADEPVQATTSAPALRTTDDLTALQTKGTAYLARTLADLSASRARPNNLIVVGSLVDNPYNLGGLSRVSEIFGASALTLQSQNVVGNRDFASVAVSSHLHLPLVQLSAFGVPGFLAERKTEGFIVVGIEQTDRSVMLGSAGAKLPEKCVLVVGSEKEGISAVVLTECDILVEIPQRGVTRSLNVQTAVSVVLFEYSRQHSPRAGESCDLQGIP